MKGTVAPSSSRPTAASTWLRWAPISPAMVWAILRASAGSSSGIGNLAACGRGRGTADCRPRPRRTEPVDSSHPAGCGTVVAPAPPGQGQADQHQCRPGDAAGEGLAIGRLQHRGLVRRGVGAARGLVFASQCVVVERVLTRLERRQHPPRVDGLLIGHAQAHAADRQPPLPVRDRGAGVVQARGDAFGLQQAERELRFDRIGIGGNGGEHGQGLRYAGRMRTTILALAVLGLAAGCGGESPAPASDAAATSASVDPATAHVVEDWPLPAMLPGSALPDLVGVDGGKLLLAWTNSQPGRRHILQFSSYDVAGARWETAPATIAIGNSMFVNWADTPHIMATHDGALWAHWLQKNGDAPYAYDVMLATSRDGGRRWSAPVSPHDDGTRTEHGFVSLWPQPQGGLGIAWLDGRNTAGSHGDGHGAHDAPSLHDADADADADAGAMTLRAAAIDGALRRSADIEIDASVCDCCQTSAAVTARGPLLVYRGRAEGEVRDILATRLDGEAWTPPKPVH